MACRVVSRRVTACRVAACHGGAAARRGTEADESVTRGEARHACAVYAARPALPVVEVPGRSGAAVYQSVTHDFGRQRAVALWPAALACAMIRAV